MKAAGRCVVWQCRFRFGMAMRDQACKGKARDGKARIGAAEQGKANV